MADPITNPTVETTTPTWTSSITDPEVIGTLQNKGWHNLDPTQAVLEAVKAYRGVEKLVGAPPDQMLRIPRPDDEPGVKSFWERLGATDKPEDYQFQGIEFDDPDWQSGFTEAVRQAAIENHIPREMAEKLAQRIFKFASDQGEKKELQTTADMAADQRSLVAEWGDPNSARFRANMYTADRALDALGVTPEQQQKLADGMGRMNVARMFQKIGSMMGEDKYVAGQAPSSTGVMSREQALARRSELMADRAWGERLFKGGTTEKRELDALVQIIASTP